MASDLRLLGPAHIDLFEGESLQLPLLIAILRALCAQRTIEADESIPSGNGPVISSRVVDLENGLFGPVKRIQESSRDLFANSQKSDPR